MLVRGTSSSCSRVGAHAAPLPAAATDASTPGRPVPHVLPLLLLLPLVLLLPLLLILIHGSPKLAGLHPLVSLLQRGVVLRVPSSLLPTEGRPDATMRRQQLG